MTNESQQAQELEHQIEAFAGRLFEAALHFADVVAVYVGDRLGLFAALRDGGPATPPDLAARTKTNERYVREWLEQQAASGILEVDAASAAAGERRYALPAAHADVLLNPTSLALMAPLVRMIVGCAVVTPRLVNAFQTGGGIPYEDFGPDIIEAQADMNRPVFHHLLGQEWLPQIADVHARLQRDGARIADVACGAGWSSIAMAQAYPTARVDGFDLDEASVRLATANIAEAGLQDRVRVERRDAGVAALAAQYDLVTVFEAVHDMARPVEVLRVMRTLVADGGAALVMDEKTAETFTAPAHEVERLFYAYSLMLCLPAGMAEQPSAATGTVMRPETLRAYALDAGFSACEVLPIDHAMFRFYRLRV